MLTLNKVADFCILDEHVRISHMINAQSSYMLAITKVADFCIMDEHVPTSLTVND